MVELLEQLIRQYPDHPDLLRLQARAALERDEPQAALDLLKQYAAARPVDAWADRKLAAVLLTLDRPADAAPHLERLDRIHSHTARYAWKLVEIYRSLDRLDDARHAILRVLARKPYDAHAHEIAAAIALQRGEPESALRHIRTLTILEPERALHYIRLAALYAKMGKPEKAAGAAREALKRNPEAPVERFVEPRRGAGL